MLQAPAVSEYSQHQIIEKTREASESAHRLLAEISAEMKPGITESQAREKAKAVFDAHGITRLWHNPYIRFGNHTIYTFMDVIKDDNILQEEDIAFIDIGPIVGEIEGDVGHTLVFGDNPLFHRLKACSEEIYEQACRFWRETQPTGVALYEEIHRMAEEAGFVFNLAPAGHLIGAFPHKGWKEGLNTYPYTPEPGLWILEIQIRHPELPYGAFYESVLL